MRAHTQKQQNLGNWAKCSLQCMLSLLTFLGFACHKEVKHKLTMRQKGEIRQTSCSGTLRKLKMQMDGFVHTYMCLYLDLLGKKWHGVLYKAKDFCCSWNCSVFWMVMNFSSFSNTVSKILSHLGSDTLACLKCIHAVSNTSVQFHISTPQSV